MVLDSLARENETTVSVVVRTLLSDWIAGHENADVAAKLLEWTGPDHDQSVVQSEDELKDELVKVSGQRAKPRPGGERQ